MYMNYCAIYIVINALRMYVKYQIFFYRLTVPHRRLA
jgi:hypothetical protein